MVNMASEAEQRAALEVCQAFFASHMDELFGEGHNISMAAHASQVIVQVDRALAEPTVHERAVVFVRSIYPSKSEYSIHQIATKVAKAVPSA